MELIREYRGRLLLVVPLLVILLAVIGWPLLNTVWLSFTDASLGGPTGQVIGFDNYLHAFRAPGFRLRRRWRRRAPDNSA